MKIEHGENRGVVIGDHEGRTVESLRLVDQHIAALVVSIISHYYTTCVGGNGLVVGLGAISHYYTTCVGREWLGGGTGSY